MTCRIRDLGRVIVEAPPVGPCNLDLLPFGGADEDTRKLSFAMKSVQHAHYSQAIRPRLSGRTVKLTSTRDHR